MLNAISLGAGVQSTTMYYMAEAGEIEPMPDIAIMADTQDEPKAVYAHLAYLQARNAKKIPIEVVTAGKLSDQIMKSSQGTGRNDGRPPFFIKNPDGSRGILNRQCTADFKLGPLHGKVRALLGLAKGQSVRTLPSVKALGIKRSQPVPPLVTSWIGISLDEVQRMKPSKYSWVMHRHPLIEMKMTRTDCERWLTEHGYPIPSKSACVYCPFRSDAEWIRLRSEDPDGFEKAVEIDRAIRSPSYKNLIGEAYVHASLKPLAEVVFDPTPRPKKWFQDNLWNNECEGMCGV